MTSKVLAIGISLLLAVSCESGVDVSSVDNENVADTDVYEVQDVAAEKENDVDVSDVADPDNEVPDIQSDDHESVDEDGDDNSVQDIDEGSDIEDVTNDEFPDEDYEIVLEEACETSEGCVFDTSWMLPEEDWDSWAYLQVVGEFGESSRSAHCADFNFRTNVLKAREAYDSVSISNSTGTNVGVYGSNTTIYYSEIDYYNGYSQVFYKKIYLGFTFPTTVFPYLKESGVRETDFGPPAVISQTFSHSASHKGGTDTFFYKRCVLGIAKIRDDLPVGNMTGCFDNIINGEPGEKLEMMFRVQIEDDKDKLLEYSNIKYDGSIAVRGDEDFSPYCHCSYDEEEQKLTCYNYDGVEEYYEARYFYFW